MSVKVYAMMYGLADEIRRSAVSVPSNIPKGATRSRDRKFLKFLFIARLSLSELGTQLTIAKALGFLAETGNELDVNVDKEKSRGS